MPSLLGCVSLGCATGAFGVGVHWFTHRRDAPGRERDLPVWSVSFLVVVAVVAAIPGARLKMEERRLNRVSAQLVGHHVTVKCQTGAAAFVDAGSELGWVPFGADGVPLPRTLIKRDQCRLLEAYRKGNHTRPTEDQIVAVHVLTHESMHMRGEPNEARAECEAVQRDALTAQALGATPAEGALLAVRYYTTVYPRMPEEYFSSDCRAGGSLDEQLESSPWNLLGASTTG